MSTIMDCDLKWHTRRHKSPQYDPVGQEGTQGVCVGDE